MSTFTGRPKVPCRFYKSPKGCFRGDGCTFLHDPSAVAVASQPYEADDLHKWARGLGHNGETVGMYRLSDLFQKAVELVKQGGNNAQGVITRLANEEGLKCINEISEHAQRRSVKAFERLVLPFFQVLCEDTIRNSFLLENDLGTIYNFLYGPNGRRASAIFSYAVSEFQSFRRAATREQAASALNVIALSFSNVIELNSNASLVEELKDVCHIMLAFLDGPMEDRFLLRPAMTALEKTSKRFAIAAEIPRFDSAAPKKLEPTTQPTFKLARDGPGSLSKEGPRHDNDFPDITKIKILPTASELASSRSEYLPVLDLSQSHQEGIKALLDRQFRLLREDTVGQLRDATKSVLDDQADKSNNARTLVYENASIVRLDFDKFRGLDIVCVFDQPNEVQVMKAKERKEWWQQSKRLQTGASVCLLGARTGPIFCSVCETGLEKEVLGIPQYGKQDGDVFTDSQRAYAVFTLVDTTQDSVESILNELVGGQGYGLEALVEFPGVLVPSFKPTLEALQRMSKRADSVPFASLIAPTDASDGTVIKLDLPLYARHPGFRYDLRRLTHDRKVELSYSPLTDDTEFLEQELSEHTTLDAGQARSLRQALSQELTLIQGPPGTGKTFLGVCIIQALLANRLDAHIGPIICVCYTNHALDQLLEHLLNKGIKQIIRIGSRSKSERLSMLTLLQIGREMERTRTENGIHYKYKKDVERSATNLRELLRELEDAESLTSVRGFLSNHEPYHYDSLFEEEIDDEGYETVTYGSGNVVRDWLYGRGQHKLCNFNGDSRSLDELKGAPLGSMSLQERRTLYQHWTGRIRQHVLSQIKFELRDYIRAKYNLDAIKKETDLRCLKQAHVIGVTTSGLARVVNLLERVNAKVLVCEEAGEVLEAHMLSTFLPSIEHAIFIGDQQQLRPQVKNYDLTMESPRGKQYSFDLSLFERLIDGASSGGPQLPYSTLELQRRMHPSISELVRITSYPSLIDDSSVEEYPEVLGMRRRLFWLDHGHLEAAASKDILMATSHSNDWEVEMVAALVTHLVSQGVYTSQDIAVLTPYLGQMRKLRTRLANSFVINVNEIDQAELDESGEPQEEAAVQAQNVQLLQGIRLASVDNFQGEEAKVVIVSLVRCNEGRRCGFLRTPNRVNVLLSRAKHGMYLIGNKASYEGVRMWNQIIEEIQQDGNLGTELELACPRHPDTPLIAKTPDDFSILSPEGGCNLKCANRLQCGHACPQKCHSEMRHNAVKCLEPCQRGLKGCDDHPCPRVCGDKCPPKCKVTIPDVELPCGHITALLCWESKDLSEAKCLEDVTHTMRACGHEIVVKCHQLKEPSAILCTAVCREALQCGHMCKRICHTCKILNQDRDQVAITDHGTCSQVCNRPCKLCRHSCQATCHGNEPCTPCNAPCEVRCAHSACSKKCSEPCTPCAEEQCVSQCPHQRCELPCAVPCNWKPCSLRCEKVLKCGHQCPSLCGESCPSHTFCQECASDGILETEVDFIVGERYGEVDLNTDPCIFLLCGHFFTRSSMDDIVGMSDHYRLDEAGSIEAIESSIEPFNASDLKTCPKCRGTLRNICRYGRIVKRALLDESIKRFVAWAHKVYVEFEEKALDMESELGSMTVQKPYQGPLQLQGARKDQLKAVKLVIDKKEAFAMLKKLDKFFKKIQAEEQPNRRVWSLVENLRRRNGIKVDEVPGELTKIEMRYQTYALSLLLKLDLAIFSAAVSFKKADLTIEKVDAARKSDDFIVDFTSNRHECLRLIQTARESKYPRQETQGHLLFAQYCCLEISVASISEGSQPRERETDRNGNKTMGPRTPAAEDLEELASMHLEEAKGLCEEHIGQTRGLLEEIETTIKMIRQSFFEPVTSEERLQVLKAMSKELSAYGAWYYCANGHPFTVGECGLPTERARCPECGAPAGGQGHVRAEGVRAAHDLNDLMGRARLD